MDLIQQRDQIAPSSTSLSVGPKATMSPVLAAIPMCSLRQSFWPSDLCCRQSEDDRLWLIAAVIEVLSHVRFGSVARDRAQADQSPVAA
jgi:hypothetical protein